MVFTHLDSCYHYYCFDEMIKASYNLTYQPRLPLSDWLDKANFIQPEPMTDKWAGRVSARQHNLSDALCQPYDRKYGARGSYTLLITDIMIHLHEYTNNYKTLDHKCMYTRHSRVTLPKYTRVEL